MVTIKELESRVGGLSAPSKIPGFSYGIPATKCKVGSILRKRSGSVCSKCYAHKGFYAYANPQKAQARRIAIMQADLPAWTTNMVALLSRKYEKREKVFRWHDSGDLQGRAHLSAIVAIADALPDFKFWLPSKERALIRQWIRAHRRFPPNLTVRVSAPMLGRKAIPIPGTVSSTVGAKVGYRCPAPEQGGKCGDCRACWKRSVKSIDYAPH